MSRKFAVFCLVAFIALPAPGGAAELPTTVTVGDWGSGAKGEVDSVRIEGEDIYLNGVLQKEKYKPGTDVIVRDGRLATVPHDSAADAEMAKAKAAAKERRQKEKEALKASIKSGVDKDAIKREAAAGLEKGAIKTSTGTVVNKGGTVRIGNKVYTDETPATDKDIPPNARKAIEDAKKLSQ